jgi:hypothetical protein
VACSGTAFLSQNVPGVSEEVYRNPGLHIRFSYRDWRARALTNLRKVSVGLKDIVLEAHILGDNSSGDRIICTVFHKSIMHRKFSTD